LEEKGLCPMLCPASVPLHPLREMLDGEVRQAGWDTYPMAGRTAAIIGGMQHMPNSPASNPALVKKLKHVSAPLRNALLDISQSRRDKTASTKKSNPGAATHNDETTAKKGRGRKHPR
jgi:hypothetical protein